ncbi:MAG: threonine--tRNA ligase [Candidatus Omnitrophota bacterium]
MTNLPTLRHSCAHILAQAVKELWPQARLGIGPATEDGFYYDFDCGHKFVPEDLAKIEKKMREIIAQGPAFRKKEVSRDEAKEVFARRNEPYKLQLLEELGDESISLYETGNSFVDLCRGPHIASAKEVKAFKLLSLAGAYWQGDEKNASLQRIYGTAFFDKKELNDYIESLREAKRRDHRRLGKDLQYFSIEEEMGPGLIFWQPKAAVTRRIIEELWKDEHIRRGYQLVNTPHIGKADLWKTSGHWEFYRDYIFPTMEIEGRQYILKPMNCPGHILIYKDRLRSWRDLPFRLAELGTVYRYERSGVLHGLLRVRGFTQDDAHIFCSGQQLAKEIEGVLDLTFSLLKKFGFSQYELYLSTMPEKHIGSSQAWEEATSALKQALDKHKADWQEDKGEGVFYGPKIDLKIKDALGRLWQCTTVQVDFNLPQRFGLEFVNPAGKAEQPIMVHRAIFGSLERFLGILLEHYCGELPTWLAPLQAIIVPIKDNCLEYAGEVREKFREAKLRVEIDRRPERMDKKIREAELQKIPYILVVGEREAQENKVSVRQKGKGRLGVMDMEEAIETISNS